MTMTKSTAGESWQKAFENLDSDVKASISSVGARRYGIVQAVLKATENKRRICLARQWKYKTPKGKTIILRDVLDKIVGWVNRFKEAGDVAMQFDPGHVALPWAAIRFLLNLAIGDAQLFGDMLVNLETISRLIYRSKVVENSYLHQSQKSDVVAALDEALIRLHTEILLVLSRIVEYFKKRTLSRILSSALQIDESPKLMQAVETQERELLKWVALADSNTLQTTDARTIEIATRAAALSSRLDADMNRLVDTSYVVRKHLDEERLTDVLKWLSGRTFTNYQQSIASRRILNSGGWLLEHPDFRSWVDCSSSGTLLLHGVAGCGKTTLFSLIASQFQASPIPCAYFYCDNLPAEPDRSDPDSILRSIVRQLAVEAANGYISQTVLSVYEKRRKACALDQADLVKLGLDESVSLLLELTMSNPAYIMVDSLDQLRDEERAIVVNALRTLVEKSANVVKVFITSRDNCHVDALTDDAMKIRISPTHNQEDVRIYVNHRVQNAHRDRLILNGTASTALLQRISAKLVEGAGEMFLWVNLQLDFLRQRRTEQDLLAALEQNMTGNLGQLYERTLSQFLAMDSMSKEAVRQIFSILLYAKQPLHRTAVIRTLALNHRLGTDTDTAVQDICFNLVLLDEEGVFRFCHPSAAEYMRRQELFSAVSANELLAYLCLRECALGPSTSSVPFLHAGNNIVQHFYHYAAVHWPDHVRVVEQEDTGHIQSGNIHKEVLSFALLDDEDNPFNVVASLAFIAWLDWMRQVCEVLPQYDSVKSMFEPVFCDNEESSLVFVASCFGLCGLLRGALAANLNPNLKSRTGHTAVYLASSYGHSELVSILFEYGADIHLESGSFKTPANVACSRGHLDVLKTLKRCDASILGSPVSLISAYKAACLGRREDVALFLVKEVTTVITALLDSGPCSHQSLLEQGLEAGFARVVKFLMLSSTQMKWGLTAYDNHPSSATQLVSAAIKQGQVNVLDSLFQQRPHLLQALPKNAVALAALSGRDNMVEFLFTIESIDHDAQGPFGPPLRSACIGGHEGVARTLLGLGADPGSGGEQGDPLQAASINGHTQIMKILIDAGADVNQPGNPRGSPLQAAAFYGHREAVELLLDAGADMYLAGGSRDALFAAAEGGHEKIATLMLERGYQAPMGVAFPVIVRGVSSRRRKMESTPGSLRERSGVDPEEPGDAISLTTDDEASASSHESESEQELEDEEDSNSDPHIEFVTLSASLGQTGRLQHYLLREGASWRDAREAAKAAARHGRVEVLEFLEASGIAERLEPAREGLLIQSMFSAARHGQVGSLQQLFQWKYRLASADMHRYLDYFHYGTLLDHAVYSGDLPTIKAVLSRHARSPADALKVHFIALETATRRKFPHICRLLWDWIFVNSGVDNSSTADVPPASAEMVRFLESLNPNVQYQVDPNDQRLRLERVMITAVSYKEETMVKAIVSKLERGGSHSSSALDGAFISACSKGLTEVKLLLTSLTGSLTLTREQICLGIPKAATNGRGRVLRYLILEELEGFISESQQGLLLEAFLGAARAGRTTLVKLMVDIFEKGLLKNVTVDDTCLLLTRGVVAAAEKGHVEVAEFLLSKGADVDRRVPELHDALEELQWGPSDMDDSSTSPDNNPWVYTPGVSRDFSRPTRERKRQSRAIKTKYNTIGLKRCAEINALQAALRGFRHLGAMENIDVNPVDVESAQAFWRKSREKHEVTSRSHETAVMTMLDRGCDPTDDGGQLEYPMQYAARWGNDRIVQTLLDAGADADATATDDETKRPVCLAAQRKSGMAYRVILRLVRAGAKIPTQGPDGLLAPCMIRVLKTAMESPHVLPFVFCNTYGQLNREDPLHAGTQGFSMDTARRFLNSGIRALLVEIFKQIPQQDAGHPVFRELLVVAASAGDVACVKLLMKHGVHFNGDFNPMVMTTIRGRVEDSALACAAQFGHLQVMKVLLDAGATVDLGHIYGPQEPMVKAIYGGHVLAVKLLIEHGAKPKRECGTSFLIRSVMSGNAAMVRCLLEAGAPVEGEERAFIMACESGDIEMVSSFLAAGASADCLATCLIPYGVTPPGAGHIICSPLSQACQRGHINIMELLLRHGADPNVDTGDALGYPLVLAARQGNLAAVRTLLGSGADPNLRGRGIAGLPAELKRAVSDRWERVYYCFRQNKLEFHEEQDTAAGRYNLTFPTALAIACKYGHREVVEELLASGVRVFGLGFPNAIGNTCLGTWTPAKASILELVAEAALAHDNWEIALRQALEIAAFVARNRAAFEILLEFLPLPIDTHVYTSACACGSINTVRRCVASNMDVNQPDANGNLPLHWAAYAMDRDVVEYLVSHAADININQVDGHGRTPLLAAMRGYKESLAKGHNGFGSLHGNAAGIQDLIEYLLANGARGKVGGVEYHEVFREACATGYIGLTRLFIRYNISKRGG
ncbi:ankyrin repeat-containing domain protein [Aspergillus stella-maris]|uniref:ankyrin repeat-containing domain protein n=1 Tax=Aspergillus stella-maris TaxID=1810926 RepID=UPI003CCCEF28